MASGAAGRLQVVGRLIAVTGAVVTFAVTVWYAQYLIQYALSHGAWGGAGLYPVVFALRLAVAGWVVWAALGSDRFVLLRVLLAAFGVSFIFLYGWYYMLMGMDDAIFYLAVSADLLYLIGTLPIGGAIVLSRIGSNPRNNRLEA
ncbi:hypothetical protein GBA63_05395 [Rubrobacter tropicus]|uniref:Uncharacterized protein n=1 Tax=Rubrobacter tropicus TaxID=2653851 RepID=A0A6G8Q6R7_9ACTN|nr:hypothetical protein [Rubrobacter tropicus]QIN82143.1 hypothetical protein GBA63_05395 [Rubrobacter tropicus]